jgi:hypothetical protein
VPSAGILVAGSHEITLMRKHTHFRLRLTLLFGAVLILAAQDEHITSFTGTWKLNLAKSKFNPGPQFKTFTITFTPDGSRHLDLIGADGQPLKASLPWSDGKEVSVTGIENATATSKIQGRTFHDIWKQNGKVIEDVHGIVSPDGKTLKTTVDGTDRQGRRSYHNELAFERQ